MTTSRQELLLATAGGCLLAVIILGPVLGPGSLFLLDVAAVPEPPFSRGFLGLGPEIPRSTPFDSLLNLPSVLVGGDTATKVVLAASIALAAAGAYRAVRDRGVGVAAASALLYAGSPFLLTRLSVGHLSIGVVAAALPWALPALRSVPTDLRPTFLFTLLLSLAGSYGGIVAAALVLAATVRRDMRRLPAVALVVTAACSIWLVPGAVVMSGAPDLVSSAQFPTALGTWSDVLELLAGHGFWQEPYQVGASDALVPLVGLVLGGLAVLGAPDLPASWRSPLTLAGVAGLAVALAPAVPGADAAVEWWTSTPIGAPLREGQRYLLLYVLWMSTAAPLGAQRLARAIGPSARLAGVAVPLALAVLLTAPGTWGLARHVRAVEVPTAWSEARAVVRERGGTTLVLPWARYLSLRFAGAPRAINPIPKYFGTDVLTSTDLGLGGDSTEGIDPREPAAEAIAAAVASGAASQALEELHALGVRWVFVIHDGSYQRYLPGLLRLDLPTAVVGAEGTLYEVPGVPAEGRTSDGQDVAVRRTTPAVADADVGDAFTWFEPYQSGWIRGSALVGRDDRGLMEVPPGGTLWFWPTLLVLAAYAGTVTAAILCWRSTRAPTRPPLEGAEPDPPGSGSPPRAPGSVDPTPHLTAPTQR